MSRKTSGTPVAAQRRIEDTIDFKFLVTISTSSTTCRGLHNRDTVTWHISRLHTKFSIRYWIELGSSSLGFSTMSTILPLALFARSASVAIFTVTMAFMPTASSDSNWPGSFPVCFADIPATFTHCSSTAGY